MSVRAPVAVHRAVWAQAARALPALFTVVLALACAKASSEQDSEQAAAPCRGACDDHGAVRPTPLPRPECPDEQPQPGDRCAVDAQQLCGWGDADDATCRSVLQCQARVWTAPPPYSFFSPLACARSLPQDCPEQLPQQDTQCLISLGVPVKCAYAGALTCYCGGPRVSQPGTLSRWACYGPPDDVRCPERMPNLGEGCAEPGVECDYSPFYDPCLGPIASRRCSEGAWAVPVRDTVCDL